MTHTKFKNIPKLLFEMQDGLDTNIAKEKNLDNKDVISHRILAALVELGEFTNEWREFKFWSENRKSNTRAVNLDAIGIKRLEKGEITDLTPYIEDPMLEEYVDVLHFILSIGNHLNMSHIKINLDNPVIKSTTQETILQVFNDLSGISNKIKTVDLSEESVNTIETKNKYETLFNRYIQLGVNQLEYTLDEIVQAYFDKNEINYERQKTGY